MFESPEMLILGLLTGVLFGFLLQKGRVAKFHTILGQLLLKDWTVLKVMLTAIMVGAVGVYALVAIGAATLDIWPFQIGGVLVGAVLFGIGLAVFGYCPGTSITASGEGSRDAMVGVVGMLVGAAIFVGAYPWLEPVIKGLGNRGPVTLPNWLGVSAWSIIIVLVVLGVIVLWLVERYTHTTMRSSSQDNQLPHRPRWFERPPRAAHR